jgi:uncharacterized delta-60 repeat protein
MKKVLISLCFLGFTQLVFAQDGTLDNSFGTNGKVLTSVSANNDFASQLVVQVDGKIIVGATSYSGTPSYNKSNIALIRYNPNGTIDNTFGTNGIVETKFNNVQCSLSRMTSQSDGKIVICGESGFDFLILRYNSDGSLDNTFGTNGKVTTDFGGADNPLAMTIQTDGKIIVVGQTSDFFAANTRTKIAIARYNSNGSLDNSFNQTGKIIKHINVDKDDFPYSVAVQADNKIIIGGEETALPILEQSTFLIRYNPNGTFDTGFGANGVAIVDRLYTFHKILNDGKILIAGTDRDTATFFKMIRFNSNGLIDNSFGTNGTIATQIGDITFLSGGLILQKDGKMVMSGETGSPTNSTFNIMRFNPNGSFDNTFGTNGKTLISPILSDEHHSLAAQQADGKLLTLGRSSNGTKYNINIIRFSNTVINVAINNPKVENNNSFIIYPNPTKGDLTIDFKKPLVHDFSLTITDISGRIVYQNKYDKALINNTLKINIGDLISGLYVVTIQSEKEIMSQLISKN